MRTTTCCLNRFPSIESPKAVTCGLSLVLVFVLSASGQEALHSAVVGDRAYQARNTGVFLPQDEGLRTGPVTYAISLGYGLEWNDNIRYENSNQKSDFIHSPRANIRATWQATRESVLSFGLGFGYYKYMDNDDLDRMFIAPDSELAWDIPVKDWVFTVYDRFQYSQDVASQGALSGYAAFPRLDNTIGARARWMPDRYVLAAGYGHSTFYSDSGDFDYLNRSSEQLFVRAGYRFAEVTQAGVEASGGLTTYDSTQQRDNQNISVGPYVNWQITEATDITLRGGYVLYHYDAKNLSPASDLSSWYVGGDVRNRLTDDFSHSLSVSREVQQGLNLGAEFIEMLVVRYGPSWTFHRQGTLSADVQYEHGSEPQLVAGRTYDRYGFGTTLRWRFTRHLSAGAGYRFFNKSSDDTSYDYRVNSVTLNADYQF